MLHDREIKRMIACGYITVDPYRPENVQPASLDITLEVAGVNAEVVVTAAGVPQR